MYLILTVVNLSIRFPCALLPDLLQNSPISTFQNNMAKSPLLRSGTQKVRRHNPLSDDVTSAGPLRTKSNKRKKAGDEEDRYVDSRSSRKILRIGQDLVNDEQEQFDARTPNPAFAFESRHGGEGEPDEESQVDEEEEAWGDEDDEIIDGLVWIKLVRANSLLLELSPNYRRRPILTI